MRTAVKKINKVRIEWLSWGGGLHYVRVSDEDGSDRSTEGGASQVKMGQNTPCRKPMQRKERPVGKQYWKVTSITRNQGTMKRGREQMDKGTYWEATGITKTCDLGFLKFTLVSIWKKKTTRVKSKAGTRVRRLL